MIFKLQAFFKVSVTLTCCNYYFNFWTNFYFFKQTVNKSKKMCKKQISILLRTQTIFVCCRLWLTKRCYVQIPFKSVKTFKIRASRYVALPKGLSVYQMSWCDRFVWTPCTFTHTHTHRFLPITVSNVCGAVSESSKPALRTTMSF